MWEVHLGNIQIKSLEINHEFKQQQQRTNRREKKKKDVMCATEMEIASHQCIFRFIEFVFFFLSIHRPQTNFNCCWYCFFFPSIRFDLLLFCLWSMVFGWVYLRFSKNAFAASLYHSFIVFRFLLLKKKKKMSVVIKMIAKKKTTIVECEPLN